VLNFRDLSRGLSAAQPFYGLQASGVDGVSRPHESITDMARAYVFEIRKRQPRGPFLIGGYSAGGIVAFEMAKQLTAQADRVALLALIDTMHPAVPARRVSLRARWRRLREEGSGYVAEAVGRRRRLWRQRRDLRSIARCVSRGEPLPFGLRELRLTENFRRIVRGYACEPWAGRATLFRSSVAPRLYPDAGPTYGWEGAVLGGVDVVVVPGDHHTLLRGENARPLARVLAGAIERAIGRELTV
jgi:thioesterase domain-containing protein